MIEVVRKEKTLPHSLGGKVTTKKKERKLARKNHLGLLQSVATMPLRY